MLGDALEHMTDYVANSPFPDETIMNLSGRDLSPRQILVEVEQGTELGNLLRQHYQQCLGRQESQMS